MKAKQSKKSIVQDATERAKVENIKETIQELADETKRPFEFGQAKHRLKTLVKQVGNLKEARKRLERILKGDDLTDISYLTLGAQRARAVCRVVICCNGVVDGYGTGFLIAPGVLMTNHHVLPSLDHVCESYAEFNYERDRKGSIIPVKFKLCSSPKPILFEEYDLAIAAVEARSVDGRPLEDFGWMKLNPEPGKAFIGEYLTAIQHPRGEPKQVCVRENKLLKYSESDPYLWYQTDTDSGSSGAPVFNNSWEVVALHHSAVANTNENGDMLTWDGQPVDQYTDGEEIAWIANEGVRVSRIVSYLKELGQHPLAQAVLSASDPPILEERPAAAPTPAPSVGAGSIQVRSEADGVTHILVPVEIRVKVGVGGLENGSPASQTVPSAQVVTERPKPAIPVSPGEGLEKIVVDQSNYHERNGYDPMFLGENLVVPLPFVTRLARDTFGDVQTFGDDKREELKYWNYSVVMNAARRIAYFSAANVDRGNAVGIRDAYDTWYEDTRVKGSQVGREFYGVPFDKGHLTSRSDLQWATEADAIKYGKTREEIAKRNGDDSYHWTNCAPQHGAFNRDNRENGLWRGLETSLSLLSGEDVTKFCILNGPVFNAPKSIMDAATNRLISLNLKGPRQLDGKHKDVQVPRLFFKVIAYQINGRLYAKAFVVSQENVINRVVQEALTAEEIKLYRVSVVDLQDLTGLDFGPLCEADELSMQPPPRMVSA